MGRQNGTGGIYMGHHMDIPATLPIRIRGEGRPPGAEMPAFETNRSIGPKWRVAISTRFLMSASLPTSAGTDRPPICSATTAAPFLIIIGHHDTLRPLGGKPVTQPATDARGAASDDNHFILNFHKLPLVPIFVDERQYNCLDDRVSCFLNFHYNVRCYINWSRCQQIIDRKWLKTISRPNAAEKAPPGKEESPLSSAAQPDFPVNMGPVVA